MKLFLLLGNQLFSPKYLNDFKDHTFFMAEDYGLCTFEKHHKLKILLFLSSMRSFRDEIKSKNFNLIYKDINKYVLNLKIILVTILVVVAIASIPIVVTSGNVHFKHALEWNYFVGVILFYLLTSLFWRKNS